MINEGSYSRPELVRVGAIKLFLLFLHYQHHGKENWSPLLSFVFHQLFSTFFQSKIPVKRSRLYVLPT